MRSAAASTTPIHLGFLLLVLTPSCGGGGGRHHGNSSSFLSMQARVPGSPEGVWVIWADDRNGNLDVWGNGGKP